MNKPSRTEPSTIAARPANKLVRSKPNPMVLEQRFMFDGAAVDTTLAVTKPVVDPLLHFVAADTALPAAVITARADTEKLVTDYLSQPDARDQLFALFNGGQSTPSAAWQAAVDQLLANLKTGGDAVRVELRTSAELQGALGAYSDQGTSGTPTIYLSADYASSASADAIQAVLIEELGHAIDRKVNNGADSLGDEGHAFASLLLNGATNAMAAGSENDHQTVSMEGQLVSVETAAPYAIAQTHYVPMAEPDIQTALKAINTGVTGTIQTVIAITATSNGTTVVYDHWEDGYEADITNPTQASTKVFTYNNGWFVDSNGDGIHNNAEAAPTGTGINVNGQSIILSNAVSPTSPATVDFDGRDKIGSTKAVAVTRAGWSATPGTVLAGAVNVIDTGNAGKVYTLPIGQNVETVAAGTNKLFEYTSAHIIATQNGTTVQIDKDGNGSTDLTITLNEGQSYFVNGGLNAGAKVTADKGIGVYLIAGDVASAYENRWFALTPDEQWASSYYAPVSTTLTSDPAYVVLYNPSATTAITVKWDTGAGAQTAITIAAKSTGYALMPTSAAHFYTANGDKFFAVGVIDADATSNATHDWSYSLVPETYLTDKFVVGWGPGADNVTRTIASSDLNASPIWLTPVDNTIIYVDSTTLQLKDGSGNLITGTTEVATGDHPARTKFTISKLQSYRLFDTSDKNQTGLTVYTLDGTLLTAAWGEDPSIAGAGTPYLDMGTTITPFPDYVLSKSSAETSTSVAAGASDNDTIIELGEQITYTVCLTNRAVIDLYDIVLKDSITPADSATYIADSTVLTVYNPEGTKAWDVIGNTQTFYDASGNVTSTVTLTTGSLAGSSFPLAGDGYRIADLNPSTPTIDGLKRGGVVEISYRVQVRSSINKTLADANYVVTNSVQMAGGGNVVKNTVNETQLSVNVTDGEVFLMDSGFTKTVSSYIPGTDTMGLRVVDGDQNKNTGIAETLTVVVTNTTTGEIETRTLTETGVNTGIFQGTLATSGSGSGNNNGTLTMVVGNSIKVEYIDPASGQTGAVTGIDSPSNWGITPATYTSGTNTNQKTAVAVSNPPPTPTDGKVEFFDSAFATNAGNFKLGESVGIRVTDADQNLNASAPDALTVTVTNSSTGETETVTLTETGNSTGIFQALLTTSTSSSDGANNSGTLLANVGNSLQVDYTDPITGSTYDNPSKPGINSPYATGNANRDTTTLTAIKTLYLSGTNDLDRVDPVVATDNSTSTSASVTSGSGSGNAYYQDAFGTVAYSNDNSSGVTWTTSWIEDENANGVADPSPNASTGNVQIVSGALKLVGGSNVNPDVSRALDLSSADTNQAITLSFNVTANSLGNTGVTEKVTLEISTDGGSSFSAITLGSLSNVTGSMKFGQELSNSNALPGAFVGDDSGSATYSADIKSLIVGATQTSNVIIRFNANALSSGSAYLTVDNFKVAFSSGSVASPATFTQSIPMATDFAMPAGGEIKIVSYVSSASGLTSGTVNVDAKLTYGTSSNIIDITTATYDSSAGTLTWIGNLSNATTVTAGTAVKLVVTNNVAGSSFTIDYDSSNKPSRIDLPTTTVIAVVDVDGNSGNGIQEIGFYDKPYSQGGTLINGIGAIDAGGTVYVRVKVSDPFGDYDITSLPLSIDGPEAMGDVSITLANANVVDTNDNGVYKIYEYVWQTINNTGAYTVTATAKEGYENTVAATGIASLVVQALDLGTPSKTEFIDALDGAISGATYLAGATAYLRVTDMDKSNSGTVTVTVNGTSYTLLETATKGVFEGATLPGLTTGTILNARYVDAVDGTDISTDSISVPVPANNAPTATNNSRTINENQSANSTNLIASNEGSGVDTDSDVGDVPNLKIVAVNSGSIDQTTSSTVTTVDLPSGAILTVQPGGNYSYNPNGAYNYLRSGQSATDTFTYTISDGRGGSSTATATITINGIDDPALNVNSIEVNEASPWAVFEVSGVANQLTTLALATGGNNPATPSGVDYATASTSVLAYSSDSGANWITYAGGNVALSGSGKLLVRTAIVNDNISDNNETFKLMATNASDIAVYGTATIKDDGTGGVFKDDGTTDETATKDDDRPTLTVAGADDVSEGSYAVFTVTLDEALATATDIKLLLADGSALVASDLNSISMEIVTDPTANTGTGTSVTNSSNYTLAAGTKTFYVRIRTNADIPAVYEGSENFSLTASFTSAALLYADRIGTDTTLRVGASANDTTTILDNGAGKVYDGKGNSTPTGADDDRPTFSIDDVTVNEAAGTMTFTVTKTGNTALASSVQYALADGTALVASDYTTTSGTLNFAAGDTSKTITVTILNDTPVVYEGSESFNVNLSTATNATISDAQGAGTIKDDGTGNSSNGGSGSGTDDDRPAFSVGDVSISEGGLMTFTVTRTGASDVSQTVDVSTLTLASPDTAEVADFTAQSTTTLTFAAGVSTQTFTVQSAQDTTYEGAETFRVQLANATSGAVISSTAGTATGTIVDDGRSIGETTANDDRPAFSVADVTVSEGGLMTFTVTRTGASDVSQTVAFATSIAGGNTAEEGDFTANNGTLTFAAGVTSQTFTVQTTADSPKVYEGGETFTVTLSNNSAGSTILDATGTGTVLDDGTGPGPFAGDETAADNDKPSFSVGDVTVNEAAGTMTFTVTKTGGTGLASTVDFALADGAALAGVGGDYIDNNVTHTLTFAADETNRTVTVLINNDSVFEGSESFTVNLSSATNATISDAQGVGTIKDDGTGYVPEGVTPDDDRSVTVNSISVNEGSPYGVFVVTGAPGQQVQLALQATGSTSGSNGDGGDATLGKDIGTQLEYFDGSGWQAYAAETYATIPAGGASMMVRVAITQDYEYEGAETFKLVVTTTGGQSAEGTGTIHDDGTGDIFNPGGTPDTTTPKDDDRPVASVPTPLAPEAPAPAPAPLAPPESPIAPMPPFNSATLLPEKSPLPLPQDHQNPAQNTVTSDAGFPVVVVAGTTPRLSINNGVTDQFVEPNALTRFALPFDAFAHTKSDAVIVLQAKLADGSNLPSWVQFDAQSGTFQVTPPADFKGELKIIVKASDAEGREATAPFRFFVGQDKDKPQLKGRLSLSEQIKLAGKRPTALVDLLRDADGTSVAGKPVVERSPAKVPTVREVATV